MKKVFESFKTGWKELNRTIYVGDQLRSSLNALTVVSIFTAILGIILIIINLVAHEFNVPMFIASAATLIGGTACAFFARVKKNRKIAVIIPTMFCAVAFTYYAITGASEGTAILWSFFLPIGISYFVSVRCGIYMSAYYVIFFSVLFYTPLRQYVAGYYSEVFMQRFPLLFAGLAGFTAIAMVQYHRSVLFRNEYTEMLNKEVEKQTKVAKERAERIESYNIEMVNMLAHAIDAKDRYTNGHSFRVSEYSVALADKLGWDEDEIAELRREALMHDIGKIGIPDSVLNKPGKLTPEEFSVIKSHTTIGGGILAESSKLAGASETARYHHERYDGKGYPEGLAGEKIPVHARVVSIADAYDAMHSDRIYRSGLPDEKIRSELVNGRGTQFDPVFLDAFLELFDDGTLERVAENIQ
ncbi:MAG: HD-GYP domain-containing protein [Clostridia bacterium]|nr:HD-GYP domain-containing protein [Clostridia bacterium]